MEAIVERVAIGIKSHFVSRLPEWVIAATMVSEGLILLAAGDTLGSTQAYKPLREVATEDMWGGSALTVGIGWLVALFLNGTFISFRRFSPWLRASSALLTSAWMMLFASGMRIGNPSGDGYLMHGCLAAMACVYCVLIARGVRIMDREARQCRQRKQQQQRRPGTTGTPSSSLRS